MSSEVYHEQDAYSPPTPAICYGDCGQDTTQLDAVQVRVDGFGRPWCVPCWDADDAQGRDPQWEHEQYLREKALGYDV